MNDQHDAPVFQFESRDSLAQFSVWIAPLVGGGTLGFLMWEIGGLLAIGCSAAVGLLLISGLRSSIRIYKKRIEITRKWFFIPYKSHVGASISDIFFSGDYGLDDGAMGVVVRLGNEDLHLGTAKNMHFLYHALSAHRDLDVDEDPQAGNR